MTAPPVIVLDNGSGFTKVGFAGFESPKSVFPTIMGTPNTDQRQVGGQNKDYFAGHEAIAKKDLLALRHPIENGIVNSWEDVEKIWNHTFFDELHVNPEEYSIIVTEKPLSMRSHREKQCQIMFETFHVKSYYSAIQAALTLFSLGKTTGIVYDSGEGVSHTVPLYEGYGLPHAMAQGSISGSDLTNYLIKILNNEQIDFNSANHMKENICAVAFDYVAAQQDNEESVDYVSPDGVSMKVGIERMTCPEALFQPQLIGAECEGVHHCIHNSINKCESEIRRELFENIVLCGGSTMFQGFPERVKKEIVSIALPAMKVNVIATAGRKNSVWLGGSIIGSLESFPYMSIDKAEYNEEGPTIVHRKCYC